MTLEGLTDEDLVTLFSDEKYKEKINLFVGDRVKEAVATKDKEIATLTKMNTKLVQEQPKVTTESLKEKSKIPDDFIGFASKPYGDKMDILRKHAYDGLKE